MSDLSHDELQDFSFSRLVELILQQQETIRQLQARIAQAEKPVTPPQQIPSVASTPIGDKVPAVSSRHRRHHRPWYRKLWRSILPDSPAARKYFPIILIVMVIIALCIGLYVAANYAELKSLLTAPAN